MQVVAQSLPLGECDDPLSATCAEAVYHHVVVAFKTRRRATVNQDRALGGAWSVENIVLYFVTSRVWPTLCRFRNVYTPTGAWSHHNRVVINLVAA